jgi:hypothetical protein
VESQPREFAIMQIDLKELLTAEKKNEETHRKVTAAIHLS